MMEPLQKRRISFVRIFWAFVLAPLVGWGSTILCTGILTNLLASGYYTTTWNNTLGYYAYTNVWVSTTPVTGIAIVSLLVGFFLSTGLTIAIVTS